MLAAAVADQILDVAVVDAVDLDDRVAVGFEAPAGADLELLEWARREQDARKIVSWLLRRAPRLGG